MVKSATRVLRVFEVFAELRRPLRIADLARELGIPHSSASALVRTLIRRGYMDFAPRGRSVLPTLRLTLLGSWLDDQFSSAGGLHDMLNEIAANCGETVILGAEMGSQVQYIHVIPGSHPLRYDIKRGTLRYLSDSNAGRVLLSLKSEEEIERTALRINAERAGPRIGIRKLKDEIAKIRKDGYSFRENLIVDGASVIAMRLQFQNFHRPFAVGIAGVTERLRGNLKPNVALLTKVMQKYSSGPAGAF
jgi:DNA-binding IclR family transcriptional regulator